MGSCQRAARVDSSSSALGFAMSCSPSRLWRICEIGENGCPSHYPYTAAYAILLLQSTPFFKSHMSLWIYFFSPHGPFFFPTTNWLDQWQVLKNNPLCVLRLLLRTLYVCVCAKFTIESTHMEQMERGGLSMWNGPVALLDVNPPPTPLLNSSGCLIAQ